MNKKELMNALKSHNIPEHYYNLNNTGEKDQRICVEYDNSWLVYYREKGNNFDIVKHETEEEAYDDVYNRLISSYKK